jgi:hypothetical protein
MGRGANDKRLRILPHFLFKLLLLHILLRFLFGEGIDFCPLVTRRVIRFQSYYVVGRFEFDRVGCRVLCGRVGGCVGRLLLLLLLLRQLLLLLLLLHAKVEFVHHVKVHNLEVVLVPFQNRLGFLGFTLHSFFF